VSLGRLLVLDGLGDVTLGGLGGYLDLVFSLLLELDVAGRSHYCAKYISCR